MNVLAFDIETVPDVDAGRRLYGLEGLSDDQVGRAMFHLRHQESGSDFLRHRLHRVVAISVAERLRAHANLMRPLETDYRPSVSIGVATLTPGEGAEQLLKRADDGLYRAKESGRNRVMAAV